jgi:hypothetical protein
MGYAIAMSPCLCCKRVFAYNPMRVPSSSAVTGKREPICQGCMIQLNQKRAAMGLPPFPVNPDAYEACDEGELE